MSAIDEVRSLIGYAQGSHGGDAETRSVLLSGAQAEATLLLAEEQRTANLLTLWQAQGALSEDWPDDEASGELLDQILRRLGLRS